MRNKLRNVIAATFAAAVLAGAAGCHSSSTSSAQDNPVVGSTNTSPGSTAPAATASSSAPSAAPTSTAPASAAPASGATSTAAKATAPGKAPGKPTGFTRAGRYTYDVSGTSTQPLSGTQQVSGTQTDTYDAPRGSSQHSRTTSSQGSTDQTLSVQRTGLYMQDIHLSMQGFDEDFRPVGTALFFPASYRTGSQWSWRARSTDGKYTLDVSSKVSSVSRSSVVLDSALHISGSGFDINVSQRDVVSPTYALILKEHSVTKGTAYGANISSDITRTLRSTTPS